MTELNADERNSISETPHHGVLVFSVPVLYTAIYYNKLAEGYDTTTNQFIRILTLL